MYSLGDYEFPVEKFLPKKILDQITNIRVENREIIELEAMTRKRQENLTRDGKLCILAADHPARMITRSGDDPLIMGNRQEYLGRVLRAIMDPRWGGIMGTPDILEDLLILNHLVKENGIKFSRRKGNDRMHE